VSPPRVAGRGEFERKVKKDSRGRSKESRGRRGGGVLTSAPSGPLQSGLKRKKIEKKKPGPEKGKGSGLLSDSREGTRSESQARDERKRADKGKGVKRGGPQGGKETSNSSKNKKKKE